MKKVYYHKENRKLRVGEIMDFLLIKTVVLPDEGEYFVVQDIFEDRHLVPTMFYKDYNIKLGGYYKFHIDKINCKGQIFLEPIHPEYRVNESYDFRYLGITELSDKKGRSKCYYLLEGRNGYTAYLEKCDLKIQKNNWMKYNVVKIKKAKVFLSLL